MFLGFNFDGGSSGTRMGLSIIWTMMTLSFPAFLSMVVWQLLNPQTQEFICHKDLGNEEKIVCRPKCEHGQFSLSWMQNCEPWLTCEQIEAEVKVKRPIGNGAVKTAYLAEYREWEVVYNTLLTPELYEDFRHGLQMLIGFQPNLEVVQLIGYCSNAFVTEYHRLESVDNANAVLAQDEYAKYDTMATRFGWAIKYVHVLHFLHTSPLGVRVMCDSNDLQKTLNQYLLTSDLDILVNDLDALPSVNHTSKEKIKCGHRQLFGDFVAPEQLWPHGEEEFSDERMEGYDEKTDIWKIPNLFNFFVGDVNGSESLKFTLYDIHKQCKSNNPADRPTAAEVLEVYDKAWEDFELS